MYCSECGESVSEDRFGYLIHEYRSKDSHPAHMEERDV